MVHRIILNFLQIHRRRNHSSSQGTIHLWDVIKAHHRQLGHPLEVWVWPLRLNKTHQSQKMVYSSQESQDQTKQSRLTIQEINSSHQSIHLGRKIHQRQLSRRMLMLRSPLIESLQAILMIIMTSDWNLQVVLKNRHQLLDHHNDHHRNNHISPPWS